MLSRVALSTLSLLAIFAFNGCAASTEEEEDSMEAEGAASGDEKLIVAHTSKLLYRIPGEPLQAKLLVEEGQDWELVENAPWLATLPRPVGKFMQDGSRKFRVFDWDRSKMSKPGAFGVFFRLIDATTKKPVLDEHRDPVTAGAIVSVASKKTITVTSEMPAQTIEVPDNWVLELKLPMPAPGYDWRLALPDGTRIDPYVPTRAAVGFEPAEGPRSPDYLFRFRLDHGLASFKFVSVSLHPDAELDRKSYPDGKRVEFKAVPYRVTR